MAKSQKYSCSSCGTNTLSVDGKCLYCGTVYGKPVTRRKLSKEEVRMLAKLYSPIHISGAPLKIISGVDYDNSIKIPEFNIQYAVPKKIKRINE